MAEAGDFGTKSWFLTWGERLANAGLEALTNTIAPRKVSAGTPTVTTGSVSSSPLTWIPYALIGVAALVVLLVLKKR